MMDWRDTAEKVGRRRFLRLGLEGAALAALSAAHARNGGRNVLAPAMVAQAQTLPPGPYMHLAGTDGFIHLPPSPAVGVFHPDDVALAQSEADVPAGSLTTYMFGFANVTGVASANLRDFKMRAQHGAPLITAQVGSTLTLQLSNLGLAIRPDLIDSHTLHWHGFRNAIPIFDGEPTSSVGVPIVRDLVYYYVPHYPGTYMYHCHFEETEHVHMGMVGPAIIYPAAHNPAGGDKRCYEDISTQFDREFVIFLSEVWSFAHWCDSHVQLPEWSDYRPDFYLMNGRVYPETLLGNGSRDGVSGHLVAPTGHPELKYQPVSSLVTANAGDRVLLRFINLGFMKQSLSLTGIKMKVIGRDAAPLYQPPGPDKTYTANSVLLGAGESMDVMFTAPNVSAETRFLLYNSNLQRLTNGGGRVYGGQMTEVRVRPLGGGQYPAQSAPNE
ncbi:MAG: multicopper oxidase domain-containing protein [Anaerolineae bacterium]